MPYFPPMSPLNGGFRNRLINPSGEFFQRQTTSNADDTYDFDRWYALTQTGAIAPSQLTAVADGVPFMMRMTQSQASAQRMGRAQIIEALHSRDLRGANVALSGTIRCSSSIAIRYAILAWSGTADTVTSDVVADWTSSTFTTGNFFNSTTLAVIATGSTTPSANTVTSIAVISGAVPAGTTNLIVMVWGETTLAQNATLDVGRMQLERLEPGSTATPLAVRDQGTELELCERYYEKSYDAAIAPGTSSSSGMQLLPGANTDAIGGFRFKTRKRVAPTLTFYDVNGNSARAEKFVGATQVTVTGTANISATSVRAILAVTTIELHQCQYTAECEL